MKADRILGPALKIGALLAVDFVGAVVLGVADAFLEKHRALRGKKSKRHP